MVAFIDRDGETKYNNVGNLMTIVHYGSFKNIDILFPTTGFITKNRTYREFSIGNIKDEYNRNIFGVGFIGEGGYSSDTRHYKTWWGMLGRCYDLKTQEKQPTYVGCTICEEWHNFQNFAKWYDKNYYEIQNEVICLDKDILIKGNKIYSPETCVFVPSAINSLFTKGNSRRGDLPIGVNIYDYDKTKYRARCRNRDKMVGLGMYDHIIDAFNAYKRYKENLIKEIANKYKNKIPQKLYDSMCRYEVEITD